MISVKDEYLEIEEARWNISEGVEHSCSRYGNYFIESVIVVM